MTLASQLSRLGLSVDDITYLGFSHEHPDHIGNANLFTHATWLLNEREHAYTVARDGHDGQPPAFLPAWQTVHVRKINGTVEVFGDGSVTIFQAPGHSPGHQVLLVKRTGQRPVLLSGDLWASRSNYEHDRVARFNTSRAETVASFAKVRELARKAGAEIWISHEPKDFHPELNPVRLE
jgi:N-acyl homoserine lactone hydrolase